MVRNLKLLLWKNFILKKRKTLVTVLEILMPLLFSTIIMYLRLNSLPKQMPPVTYLAIDISILPDFFYFPIHTRYQLVYVSSKSATLKAITEAVGKSFDVEFEVLGYSSVALFENYILEDSKAFFVLAGLVFDHAFNDSKQPLPLKVKYHLRFSYTQRSFLIAKLTSRDTLHGWGTSFLYPPNPSQEPRAFGHSDGGPPGYSSEGFLAIQHALDKAIMQHHAHNATTEMFKGLSVLVKRFPHRAHIQDRFLVILQNEFPLLLMLSFICIELVIINSIALEKEKKLKEYMCMMGMDNWQHWAAWFIMFFVSALVAVSFMTVLFCTQVNSVAVFRNSDPSLIFVFLLCFATATIFFAFMISTFFQKAHIATAAGGIVFFLTYLPYLYLTVTYSQRTHFQKIAFCLLSNVAMALGVRFISIFEIRRESHLSPREAVPMPCTGMRWKNAGGLSGEFNFCQVLLLLLLLDSIVYSTVAWYVEAVLPGEHGVPRPWYFFLMPSYWHGQPVPLTRPALDMGDQDRSPNSKFIQEEPTNLKKGIEIQHLYKVYHTGKNTHVAVKDLTMNLYQGQITVLLGHNGAGKTTTCFVLTGLIPPSSGWAYINGYEISRNMVEIRKSMGWCPQHDILFDDLTVAEHLSFYAQLPSQFISVIHVWPKGATLSNKDALITPRVQKPFPVAEDKGRSRPPLGPQVLMLDEPTSGMDAVSRRAIWDLLQQHKSDRTVLLTTHFMDEADLLGDRVAIMAKGELQCCGSPLFLKQKYGAGYYMTVVKKPHCSTEKISNLIYHHMPNAILQSNIGEELTFILPKKSMPRVNKLADSSTEIQALKIPSIQSHHLIGRVPVNRIKRIHSRIFSIRSGLPVHPNTGLSLLCQQFYAMLLKRVLYSWRNWLLMLTVQVLVPLLLTSLSLTLLDVDESMGNVPLELSLKTYGQTIVPFYVSPNSRLGPQLSQYFTDMLVAEEQIPLETLSKPGAQESSACCGGCGGCTLKSDSVEDLLLEKAEEEPEGFDFKYVVAASFEDEGNHTTVTALFNNQAYHSPAVALALVDNLLFKLLSGAAASITASNHPQPRSALEASEDVLYYSLKGHYLVINLLFGIAFLSSSFSILTVKERSTKAKDIQFISGVYAATFWLSALLWDLITSLVPSLLLLALFVYHKEEAFTHRGNVPAVILVLLLYGWASIPFVYLTSFCFHSEGSAFVKLLVMLTFLSIGPLVLILVTKEKDQGYTTASESLDQAFLLLPGHCLGMAFFNLYYSYGLQKLCKIKNLSPLQCNKVSEAYTVQESIYAWESLGIGKYMAALAISGSAYVILLFLIDTSVLWKLKARFSDLKGKQELGEQVASHGAMSVPGDQDVEEEAKTVQTGLEKLREENPLVLKDVSKVYASKVPVLAVNKVSFAVRAKECFGLLGVNGAGKTSIFKMLTGEEPITSGNAFIRGFNISSHLGKVRQQIGYCPQFDALLDHMTGWEMLVMYARLWGIPERHISACVEQILEELLMYAYTDKLVKTYSGGNKRKLSTGIALIGEPSVIFLDEPSTGMDPVARHLLWDTVAWARESGKAIVLTTPHSMEECEALCTRLAIMVQGQLKCLGSPQHLKSKFGSGYSLRAKVRSEGRQEVLEEFKAFVNLTFPGSVLEDEHQGMVHYHLPGGGLSWAEVFDFLEQAKKRFMLDDYSVSQVSLEDVFLSFTCPMPPTQEEEKREQAEPAPPPSQPPSPLPSESVLL
ncbi:ATP-binding cassette sub-family A member 17-like [Crocuta crocuta]